MSKINASWGKWATTFDTDNTLGEVVAWDVSVQGVPYEAVKQSLTVAGLDPALAIEIPPARALKRAVSKMRRERIISEVEDTPGRIVFQFGHVEKADAGSEDKFQVQHDYKREGRVVLDKKTGDLDGDDPEMAQTIAQALDYETKTRKTSDVTSVAHKVFRKNADLFQLRRSGGCYFVPACHAGVVDAVQKFLNGVGTGLRRYPVAKGHLTGDASVRDAVKEGIQSMLTDHATAITNFSAATRDGTMQSVLEDIKATKFKIDAYAAYLGEESKALKKKARDAEKMWAQKVQEFLGDEESTEQEPEAAEVAVPA